MVDLWSTRQVRRTKIAGSEKLVFYIPRNDLAKTPAFLFETSIPHGGVQAFLNGIQNTHVDNILVRFGINRRWGLGNDVPPIQYLTTNFHETGSMGQTKHHGGSNPHTLLISSRLGLDAPVPATFVDEVNLTPIGVSWDFWTESIARSYGFSSVDAAIAATLAHEVSHHFIRESYAHVFSGHGEVFSRVTSDVPFPGVTRGDVLFDDILAAQYGFARSNGLFRSGGEAAFLDGRVKLYNLIGRKVPNMRKALIEGIKVTFAEANRWDPNLDDSVGYEMEAGPFRALVRLGGAPIPQIDPATQAPLPQRLQRVPSIFGQNPLVSPDGTVVLDQRARVVELDVVDINGVPTVVKSRALDGWWGSGQAGVTVETTYSNGQAVSTDIKLNNNPVGVEFSDAGAILGQQLGYLLADGDVLTGIVASAALQTLGDSLGDALDGLIGRQSLARALGDATATFDQELLGNLKSAGIGALSSYLTAELIDGLGISGFAGELANTAGGVVISHIITNLASGADAFANVANLANALPTAIGSFLGTKLANEVVTFESVGGQIGSAVGSGLAVLAAGYLSLLGGPAGILIAAAAAFLGNIVGGAIGSIFGGTPRSGADVEWDAASGEFRVANAYRKYGGSKEAAVGMASAVAGTFNSILALTGGRLADGAAVQAGNYGMRKSDYVYRPVSSRDKDDITAKFDGKNGAERLIGYGIYQGLTDPDFQIVGGDLYAKRALYNTFALGGVDRNNFDQSVVMGNIAVAQRYETYLANSTAINALIAAEPDSVFTAEWAITFARAVELGLHRRHASDWYGGFGQLMHEAGVTPASVTFGLDYDPFSDRHARVIGLGDYVLGDSIDVAGQDVIAGTAGSDIIRLGGSEIAATGPARDSRAQAVAASENHAITLNGAAFDGAARTIEVAAYVEAGDGADFVYASDRGDTLLGGAGNDWLIGGRLDDWLLGGDGNDILAAAAVAADAAFSTEAALAADGGNGNYLDGGAGGDTLIGSTGSDWLAGGADRDALYGGAGGDILDAGQGNDATSSGGAGADQYVFRRGDGQDVYNDADQLNAPDPASDSVSAAVRARSNALAAKNWAGDGEFTVDGSPKGGEDAIVFGEGISLKDLMIERSGTADAPGMDLIIKVQAPDGSWDPATGDRILVRNWFDATRKIEWLRFANGDELRLADAVSFQKGSGGADVLVGTSGRDFIYGEAGDDKLFGLASNDFVAGGLGNDLASGNDDHDIVLGGNDNDVVLGGLGYDLVSGDGGNDRVYGGEGGDIVTGGRGDDELVGGAGDDLFRYERGDGKDIVFDEYAGSWEVVWQPSSDTADGVKDGWINGYSVDSHGMVSKNGVSIGKVAWDGGWDYNEIAGNKTLKRLIVPASGVRAADSGTDLIEFGIGIDPEHILFQRGVDKEGKATNDILIGVAGAGGSDLFAGLSDQLRLKEWYLAPGGIEGLSFVSTGRLTIGPGGYQLLAGTDGADTLNGGTALSWMTGGAGDDQISGGGILNGGSGSDRLTSSAGSANILYGGSGDDVLVAGNGSDLLYGGSGSDWAEFGGSAVTIYLDEAHHLLRTGDGGRARLSGIENLRGSGGADVLAGDAGANALHGGLGSDTLYGGAGDDVYVLSAAAGAGVDTIVDSPFALPIVATAAGKLATGYATSWTRLNDTPTASGHYYFRAVISDPATGAILYDSGTALAAPNYASTNASALPPFLSGGEWNLQSSAFVRGFWKVAPAALAGDGGSDTLEVETGLSLSNLAFVRTGDDLEVQRDATNKAVLKDFFASPDRRVEMIHFADGFSFALGGIRFVGQGSTAGDDFLLGDARGNTMLGGGGNDVLSGGLGNDLLYGEAGDDVFEGDAGADRIEGGTDGVTAGLPVTTEAYGDTVRYVASAEAVSINLTTAVHSGGDAAGDFLLGVENVTGSMLGDTIVGEARANRLLGLGGNDTLTGLAGADVLLGGAGDDILSGGLDEDNLSGGDGVDTLDGGDGRDLLDGGEGGDTLRGGAGDDMLVGGAGNDLLLDGGAGKDLISGGDGDDALSGGDHDDRLVGEAGGDTLQGGAGNDLLSGGAGNDTLDGGLGDDSYVFDAASDRDTIIDSTGINAIVLAGVAPEQVWLTRRGYDLVLSIIGEDAVLTVTKYFEAGGGAIASISAGDMQLFARHAAGPVYESSMVAAMTAHSDHLRLTTDGTPQARDIPAAIDEIPEAIRTLQAERWGTPGSFAPIVVDQSYSMAERSEPGSIAALAGAVDAFDPDANVAATGYSVLAQGQHGTVTLSASTPGAWSYQPLPYFNGEDSFRIRVVDADGNAAEQNVTVTVTPVNSRPISLALVNPPAAIAERDRPQAGQDMGALDLGLVTVDDPDYRPADALGTPLFGSVSGYAVALSDSRFEVGANGHLYLKAGATLDFEQLASISLSMTATDPGGLTTASPASTTFALTDREDYRAGTAGADTLTGQDSRAGLGGADRILGHAGADTISGLSGDDLLYGGPDNDTLYGNAGNDRLFGEDGHDLLFGGDGIDHIDGGAGDDRIDALNSLGADIVTGGLGNDRIYGGGANDTIYGGDGDDWIQGGAGADVLRGEAGNDTISYAPSSAGVTVSLEARIFPEGDDVYWFESVAGSELADRITGDAGTNTLTGLGGDDSLYGRAGNDLLYGGLGNDALHGEDGVDQLEGEAGNDQLHGGLGDDVLVGGANGDTLYGGAGSDVLSGGDNDDSLHGEAGSDQLDGGAGADSLDGGDGSDVYLIRRDSDADTISNIRQIDSADIDVIGYQGGVTRENLWFQRIDNNMVVSVVGTGTTTTITNWFLTASAAERSNFKVDFFVAGNRAARSMNADAMVALMGTRGKPASQAEFDLWRYDPAILAQWENNWIGNEAPTLSGVPGVQAIDEDGTLTVTIRATDEINAPETLTVTARAVNPSNPLSEDLGVVQAPVVGPAAANGDRLLTVRAQSNASGPVDIRITVVDAGGLTAEQTFRLNVVAVADKPTLTQIGHTGNTLETGPLPISLQATVQDPSEIIDHFIVSNVPAALAFNQGTHLGGGTWRLAATSVSATTYGVSGLALNQKTGWWQDLTGTAALRVEAQSLDGVSTALSDPASLSIPLNGRPTSIALASGALSVAENGAAGAVLATLSGTDPDGDMLSLSLLAGHDGGGRFAITAGGQLSTTRSLDYEEGASYVLRVRAVDPLGLDLVRDFTVTVSDQNERPAFTGTALPPVNENVATGTLVGSVTAADPDGGAFGTRQYWFAGSGSSLSSVDGSFAVSATSPDGLFVIDQATGQIRTAAAIDREVHGASRGYTVLVRDTTAAPRVATAPVAIGIADVNEAPAITSANLGSLPESMPGAGATVVTTLAWTDPDTAAAFRSPVFDIVPGEDSTYFSVEPDGRVLLQNGLDYEIRQSLSATFRITDAGGSGHTATRRLTLAVTNVNEQPVSYGEGGVQSGPGAVGDPAVTIYPADPDTADTTFFTITKVERSWDGESFAPAAGTLYQMQYTQTANLPSKVQVAPGSMPYQTWVMDRITVRVTDAGGLYRDVVGEITWNASWSHLRPIVLDLDGDGVELTGVEESTVRFDADGDGIKDQIGWAGADDGLLVYDRNGDGRIAGVEEVSFAGDVEGAQSDLEGLAAFDTNANGYFDRGDAKFGSFQVWRDANQDGTSQAGELKPLGDWGVNAIGLEGVRTNAPVEGARDNVTFATSEYYRANGSTGDVSDVFFAYYDGADFLPNGKPRPGASPRLLGRPDRPPRAAGEAVAGAALPAVEATAPAASPDPLAALRTVAAGGFSFDPTASLPAAPAPEPAGESDRLVQRMIAHAAAFGASGHGVGTYSHAMPDAGVMMLAASH